MLQASPGGVLSRMTCWSVLPRAAFSAGVFMKRMFYQVYLRDADAAIALYRQAFGAQLANELRSPEGTLIHAELAIFGQVLALSEAAPDQVSAAGNTMQFCLQYEAHEQPRLQQAWTVLEPGAQVLHPLGECFYSAAMADLIDRFGVRWCLFV